MIPPGARSDRRAHLADALSLANGMPPEPPSAWLALLAAAVATPLRP